MGKKEFSEYSFENLYVFKNSRRELDEIEDEEARQLFILEQWKNFFSKDVKADNSSKELP